MNGREYNVQVLVPLPNAKLRTFYSVSVVYDVIESRYGHFLNFIWAKDQIKIFIIIYHFRSDKQLGIDLTVYIVCTFWSV
jgi:hypothetical protein